MVDLDKLIEIIREHLRKELEREPTEEEIAQKLPPIICKS